MSLVWLNIAPYQIPHSASAAVANAHKSRQQMADRIDVERNYLFEADRDDVEQPAVEIQIPEMEQPLVGKRTPIVGDDKFAVALLDLLVIGDRVIAESREDQDNQQAEQRRGCQVRRIGR
jgi:hypothetical protein